MVMRRVLFVMAALALPTTGAAQVCKGPKPAVCEGLCGCFRWAAKTGMDGPSLASATPQNVNIGMLAKIKVPGEFRSQQACTDYFDKRVAPTEQTVFTLQNVGISQYAFEDDNDFHVVLVDQRGRTIVSEIPDPNCIVTSVGSELRAAVQKVRTRFLCRFPKAEQGPRHKFHPQRNPPKVRVTGLGFFDFTHLQGTRPRGMLPNVLEIHPVLSLEFADGKCNSEP
jgi:hypothetical protein